jgi:hypothetical protein
MVFNWFRRQKKSSESSAEGKQDSPTPEAVTPVDEAVVVPTPAPSPQNGPEQ